jgi:polysaccharide deacetylase 2 family uncharacterized protein YibQ
MDDLSAPLGLGPAKQTHSRTRRLAVIAGAAIVIVAATVVWALLVRDPSGGQPVAVAPVGKPAPAADRTGSIGLTEKKPAGGEEEASSGLVEITPATGLTELGNGVVLRDPTGDGGIQLAALPDEDLIEDGPYGPLPRSGGDGREPMTAYARPVDAEAVEGKPRIAIVVGGLGIAESGTRAAIELASDVTLAVAPYGDNLPAIVAEARQAGHEILLQIPLEPYGYPKNDPGPRTLTVAASDKENADRLAWLLSRATTYVGVTNYLGARFTSVPEKMEPFLAEVGGRGLLYLDDGSSGASRADKISPGLVPFGRADVVLDAETEAGPIDARLKQLEAIARKRGYAIGSASAFPVSIERIAAFIKDAADRGIAIVPVTALIKPDRT